MLKLKVDTHDGDGEEKATARLGSTLVTPYSGLLLRRSVFAHTSSKITPCKAVRSEAFWLQVKLKEAWRRSVRVTTPRNLHHLFTSLHEEQNEELGL